MFDPAEWSPWDSFTVNNDLVCVPLVDRQLTRRMGWSMNKDVMEEDSLILVHENVNIGHLVAPSSIGLRFETEQVQDFSLKRRDLFLFSSLDRSIHLRHRDLVCLFVVEKCTLGLLPVSRRFASRVPSSSRRVERFSSVYSSSHRSNQVANAF